MPASGTKRHFDSCASCAPFPIAVWDHIPSTSPIRTSTQVTEELQVVHKLELKLDPVESPTHHAPVAESRPAMSAFLSPSKSPIRTSTQLTNGLQFAHRLEVKLDPEESPAHQLPVAESRPTISALPSPLRSPI